MLQNMSIDTYPPQQEAASLQVMVARSFCVGRLHG